MRLKRIAVDINWNLRNWKSVCHFLIDEKLKRVWFVIEKKKMKIENFISTTFDKIAESWDFLIENLKSEHITRFCSIKF